LIGYVAILMPIVIKLGGYWYDGIPSNESISAYYYTKMRDVFTGTLIVAGALLICYRGPSTRDNIATILAGFAAVGIALLPTDPAYHIAITTVFKGMAPDHECFKMCYMNHGPLGYHFYAVAIFFALTTYLAYFRFPLPSSPNITRQKLQRNRIYKICAVVMAVSFIIIAILKYVSEKQSIFWPETTAIIAFSLAWLIKGRVVLKDPVG
jgi:hypothetical protein